MLKRLLLALDDSPANEVATAFAVALARHASASVHVLHVNEHLVSGRPGETLSTRDEVTTLLTTAVDQLRLWGIATSASATVANYRDVPKCIAETAQERDVDAIVLGSNRRKLFSRVFSAKVRERTTRLTPLPILVAPSPLKVASLDPSLIEPDRIDDPLRLLLQ